MRRNTILQNENLTDLRDIFLDEVISIAREDKDFIFLTIDMGANFLSKLKEEFPERCLNIGISEQNAILMAAGLAACGKKVFVYGITSFTVLRSIEQIKIDICHMDYPIVIAGMGTGFTYGTDGPTHYAVDDISIIGSLPEIQIFCPNDRYSTRALTRKAYESGRPTYLRLEKGTRKDIYAPESTFDNNMTLLKSGEHLIVATGIMVERALEIAEELGKEGVSVGVLDIYKLKPLDWLSLDKYTENIKSIFTIEEHVLHGGLGGIISTYLCDKKLFIPRRQFGVPRKILLDCRNREKMLELCGLDKQTLVYKIREEILKINVLDR